MEVWMKGLWGRLWGGGQGIIENGGEDRVAKRGHDKS